MKPLCSCEGCDSQRKLDKIREDVADLKALEEIADIKEVDIDVNLGE